MSDELKSAIVTENVEKLSEVDVMQLEVARVTRLNALAESEKALAQNEVAELKYKNLVLQLYLKYGLSFSDQIDPTGKILRGGAVQSSEV